MFAPFHSLFSKKFQKYKKTRKSYTKVMRWTIIIKPYRGERGTVANSAYGKMGGSAVCTFSVILTIVRNTQTEFDFKFFLRYENGFPTRFNSLFYSTFFPTNPQRIFPNSMKKKPSEWTVFSFEKLCINISFSGLNVLIFSFNFICFAILDKICAGLLKIKRNAFNNALLAYVKNPVKITAPCFISAFAAGNNTDY